MLVNIIPHTGASCNFNSVNSHDRIPPYKVTNLWCHLLVHRVTEKVKIYFLDVYSRTNKEMNDMRSGKGFH